MLRTITIPKYYLKIIRHLNSLLFPGIIQIETKFFALFIDSLSHDHREFFRHCSIYTSLSQNLYQQLLQVAFFKHTSDIPGISAFISMMRNCGILFPVRMLICRNDFCTIRNQKFHESLCLWFTTFKTCQSNFFRECKLLIIHPEDFTQNMWLSVRIYLHILVGKCSLERRDQCASLRGIIFQTCENFFICSVHSRKDDCLVFLNIFALFPDNVTLYIYFIKCIVDPANNIVVSNSTVSCCSCFDSKPFECSQSLVAHHDCNFVILLQA